MFRARSINPFEGGQISQGKVIFQLGNLGIGIVPVVSGTAIIASTYVNRREIVEIVFPAPAYKGECLGAHAGFSP